MILQCKNYQTQSHIHELNPISQIYSAKANGKHIFKCLTTNMIRREDNIKIWSAFIFESRTPWSENKLHANYRGMAQK